MFSPKQPTMAPVENAPVLASHPSYESTSSIAKAVPPESDAKDVQLVPPAQSKAVPRKLLKRYNLAYAVTTFGVSHASRRH